MTNPDLDGPPAEAIQEVNKQLPALTKLATVLLERRELTHAEQLIVPLIGAGASISAALPNSTELKDRIYRELVSVNEVGETIATALDREASSRFSQKGDGGILGLSLFEFVSVVSQFAYGRDVISDVMYSVLRQARSRPLAYELLAHLTKHGFIDNFISMNFDELLDEALDDEIADRLFVIASPDEVPGPRALRKSARRPVFLFKPFGSLSRDSYRLASEETERYGSESVFNLMVNHAFRQEAGAQVPNVCLLLVGYAAAEPAFRAFLDELLRDGRSVTLFVIDPVDTLPDSLESLDGIDLHHIQLDADLAFDLLLQIIKIKYFEDPNHYVWIPVDRHKVISCCLEQDVTRIYDRRRFKLELILQAVKSRGYFNIEAIADIHRIQKYDNQAAIVLNELCEERIMQRHRWSRDENSPRYARENYRLLSHDYEALATTVLKGCNREPEELTEEWTVRYRSGFGWEADVQPITYREFLLKRFTEIEDAPEIEVAEGVRPATRWLFRKPEPQRSVAHLTESTVDLFERAFDEAEGTIEDEAEGTIELWGAWSTGEWLFHDKGWAWSNIGLRVRELLSDESDENKLMMHLILAKPPPDVGTPTERAKRAKVVRGHLQPCIEQGNCELLELDEWRHNRTFTLLRWRARGAAKASGIYMRRRRETPLVAPVKVQGDDCKVLDEIFAYYRQRVTTKPD